MKLLHGIYSKVSPKYRRSKSWEEIAESITGIKQSNLIDLYIPCDWGKDAEKEFDSQILPLKNLIGKIIIFRNSYGLNEAELRELNNLYILISQSVKGFSISGASGFAIKTIVGVLLDGKQLKDTIMTPQDIIAVAYDRALSRNKKILQVANDLRNSVGETKYNNIELNVSVIHKTVMKVLNIPKQFHTEIKVNQDNRISLFVRNMKDNTPDDVKHVFKNWDSFSPEERKSQKRKLCSKYHPDRAGENEWIREITQLEVESEIE